MVRGRIDSLCSLHFPLLIAMLRSPFHSLNPELFLLDLPPIPLTRLSLSSLFSNLVAVIMFDY